MNRKNVKDTREILLTPQVQSKEQTAIEQIDLSSITQEDRDKLLISIALHLGVINHRTFLCPLQDSTIDDKKRAELMLNLYGKVYDYNTENWVKI